MGADRLQACKVPAYGLACEGLASERLTFSQQIQNCVRIVAGPQLSRASPKRPAFDFRAVLTEGVGVGY